MIEATSCGGVVIFRGKILIASTRIINIVMMAGFFQRGQSKQARNIRKLL